MSKYKFYQIGNEVIATYNFKGHIIQGTAMCSDKDEFDLEKGKQLATARCRLKVAEERRNRNCKKWYKALKAEEKAKAYSVKMCNHYIDSIYEIEDAQRDLKDMLKSL